MVQTMADPTQPISLGEKAKRGLWWGFLNFFSDKKPEARLPPVQEPTQKVEVSTKVEPHKLPDIEPDMTEAILIKEQPKNAVRVNFIFIIQKMKGEFSVLDQRRSKEMGETDPTSVNIIYEYNLLITTSTKDQRIKEIMPAKDSKEPIPIKSGKKPFLVEPNKPKTLFLIGASNTADISFTGEGSTSIGELSADIWVGVNNKGEVEYFLRTHEPSWCYDEATQRCIKTNESVAIVPGQQTQFWIGRVMVGDGLKPAFSLDVIIQEQ